MYGLYKGVLQARKTRGLNDLTKMGVWDNTETIKLGLELIQSNFIKVKVIHQVNLVHLQVNDDIILHLVKLVCDFFVSYLCG